MTEPTSRRLEGRRALVIGTGGIGAAIAERFAREGARVACASRGARSASDTVRRIADAGGDALAIDIDLLDPASILEGVASAVGALGALDVLVQCGGTTATTPFVDIEPQEWRRVLATNLDGTFLSCQAVVRHFLEQGIAGSVIIVGSQLANVAIPNKCHYLASKGALTMLAKGMAVELAPRGIRVNVLAPGVTRTDMAMDRLGEDGAALAWTEGRIPMGRLGEPDEMAGAAVYLASEEASYVTGSTLVVDGGYLAV